MEDRLVEVETLVDADVEAVWKALTAEKSAMFMGADVDTDWRPGSASRFTGECKGKAYEDHGEIRDVEEGRHLAFTHYSPTSGKPDVPENHNLVDFRIETKGDKTRVRLSQTPLGGKPPDEETIESFRKNWEVMLKALKDAAEDRI